MFRDQQGEKLLTIDCHDGARIALQMHPNPARPRLMLSHGNGFAIGGYRKFWQLLLTEFELCLVDLRNHGASPLHRIENHTILNMAHDLLTVRDSITRQFGARHTTGLFHSVSSIACIRGVSELAAQWDALILVDPPLIAPPGDPLREGNHKLDAFLANFARTRPRHFASIEELATQLRARAARNWVPGAEYDMAEATTRPAADGGRDLACPGEFEAKIYEENTAFESYAALAALRQPVLILGADPHMPRALPPAFSGPQAAAQFGFEHVILPETGHLLQIEKPELAARHIMDFMQRQTAA